MHRGLGLVGMFLSLLAAGCAISPNSTVSEFASSSGSNSFDVFQRDISDDALVLPVVHDAQTSGPSCGAHVLASVVNYWRGPDTLSGDALFAAQPPAHPMGYSIAEIMQLAGENGLVTNAVRLNADEVIRELERGRPVMLPIRLPSIYVQQRVLPGDDAPLVGVVRNSLIYRAGRVSEFTNLAMVDHYVLAVGYDADQFVVIEPVMGYRTINAETLSRYRQAFGDAAVVFSAQPGAAPEASVRGLVPFSVAAALLLAEARG